MCVCTHACLCERMTEGGVCVLVHVCVKEGVCACACVLMHVSVKRGQCEGAT